jgi:enediyne biosynthesis protein E4
LVSGAGTPPFTGPTSLVHSRKRVLGKSAPDKTSRYDAHLGGSMSKYIIVIGVYVGFLCGGCSEEPTATPKDTLNTDAPTSQDTLPPQDVSKSDAPDLTCQPTSRWSPGTAVFKEVTTDWKLQDMQVDGRRMSVGDFNGDGWPDLIVRSGSATKDYAPGIWLLKNTGEGHFEDVTEASGLLATRQAFEPVRTRPCEIVTWADVDNDGDLDAYCGFATKDETSQDGETSEIMLNNGDGTFSLGPVDSALRAPGMINSPNGAAFTDYDGDGHLDVFVGHHDYVPEGGGMVPITDRLYRGDGQGGFTEVTWEAGVQSSGWNISLSQLNAAEGHSWSWSVAACDLNNDGMPELLSGAYGRAPNHLWQAYASAPGKVAYFNQSVASGYAYDHREDWTDNWSACCFCQDNPQEEGCGDAQAIDPQVCAGLKQSFGENMRWNHASDREPWRLGGNSGTTICADMNNDGFIDLFTTEIVHADVGQSSDPSEIMVNQAEPNVRFERPGNEVTGLFREETASYWDHGDMTAAVFDFDNDGWADIYIGASDYPGNRGRFYHQTSALSFQELDVSDFFEHNRSHGIAVADFDRDGDLDVLVGHSHMRCNPDGPNDCYPTTQVRMFENIVGQEGNWIQLKLDGGEGSNRGAVGARVEVTAGGVTQVKQVSAGHGHYGMQHDMLLHFGLGEACEAQVKVIWPNASMSSELFTLRGNTRYLLSQGELAAEVTR